MIKIYNIIIYLVLFCSILSCEKKSSNEGFTSDTNAVHIDVSIGEGVLLKSNPDGATPNERGAFSIGDRISLKVPGQNEAVYALTDKAWIPSTEQYLIWKTPSMNFTAYYPVDGSTSETDFTLHTMQNTPVKLAAADYMTFSNNCTKGEGGKLTLQMERKMAKVKIKIGGFTSQFPPESSSVKSLKIASAGVSYKNSLVQNTVTEITPLVANGNGEVNTTYTALVIPTTANIGAQFVSLITIDNQELNVTGIPATEPGKSYTYTLTIGRREVIITNVVVENWESEELITGDVAELPFGDPTLFKVLTNLGGTYNIPITNGIIDPENAATKVALDKITNLRIEETTLRSLKGIEYLPNLKSIYLPNNKGISTVDFSRNTNLEEIRFGGTRITQLNLKMNPKLTVLQAGSWMLKELDLSNNPNLTDLQVGNNLLTELNLSSNPNLTNLQVENCLLTGLNLSSNTKLKTIFCYKNKILALSVSSLGSLEALVCGNQKDNMTITLVLTNAQKEADILSKNGDISLQNNVRIKLLE